MDNTQYDVLSQALDFVTSNTKIANESEYLETIAGFVGDLLSVQYVIISHVKGEKAETAAVYSRNSASVNSQYYLQGTPCQNVINSNICIFPSNVRQQFPEDTLLERLHVDSYIGCALHNLMGHTIGIIAVMDTKPIIDSKTIKMVLQCLSPQVSKVLERMHYEGKLHKNIKELKRLNRDLNQAQKLSKIGSWTWNMETDEAEWSDEMYRIYGVDRDSFYPSHENVSKTILEEDMPKMGEAVNHLLTHNEFKPFDFRIRRPSGEIRTVRIIALDKGKSGTPEESVITGVTQDITDQKKVETSLRQLAHIASSSADIICLVDNDYRYVTVNQAYAKSFDLTPDEMVGKYLWEVVGKDYFEDTVKPFFKKCWAGEDVQYQVWFQFPGASEERYIDIKYMPFIDEEGILQGIIINGRDITEQKRGENRLKKSLDEKNLLLRELYHRTKNNMQVISSMLALKAMYSDDSVVRRLFDETRSRILTMALVHEKLYQAQNLSSIHLDEYIGDLIDLLKQSYPVDFNHVSIETTLEKVTSNIDTAIPCGLIINELVTNALKHAFPEEMEGKIQVVLTTAGGKICLYIADDGVGLSEPIELQNSETYGLQAVYQLTVQQLNGTIEQEHAGGVRFKIAFDHVSNTKDVIV